MSIKRKGVFVEWVDSAGSSGWRSLSELHTDLIHCQTLGWLVLEDREKITIALNAVFDGGSDRPFGEFVTIPKVAVVSKHFIPLPIPTDKKATK